MSRWYRAYAGTVKDDKLAEVSVIAGCSRSVAIAVWHAILESAAETDDGGRFETTPRRVAAALCEPAAVIDSAFQAMAEIGMLAGNSVGAWKRRQYESDKSTERSRKHREAKRNADATPMQRCATPPDTETEPDTEITLPETNISTPNVRSIGKPMRPARDEIFEKFWEAYPHRGMAADPKAPAREKFDRAVKSGADPNEIIAAAARYREIERAAGRAGTDKVAQAVTWLNQRRWGDYAEAASSPSQSTAGTAQVFVEIGTEEWDAWTAFKGKKPPFKYYPEHQADGWLFPSKMPPTPQNKGERAA